MGKGKARIQRGQRGGEREELPERSKGLRGRGAVGRRQQGDLGMKIRLHPGNWRHWGIPQEQARWMGRPE